MASHDLRHIVYVSLRIDRRKIHSVVGNCCCFQRNFRLLLFCGRCLRWFLFGRVVVKMDVAVLVLKQEGVFLSSLLEVGQLGKCGLKNRHE